jgi:hypothetical protein
MGSGRNSVVNAAIQPLPTSRLLARLNRSAAGQASASGKRARGFCLLLWSRGPRPTIGLRLRTPQEAPHGVVGGRVRGRKDTLCEFCCQPCHNRERCKMADLADAYECQVFSSITTEFSVEGEFCRARTKSGDDMYQHYWLAHPELMNGGMEIKDLHNGEEFSAPYTSGYKPLNDFEVAFCKRVLPEVYCGDAFDEAFHAALTWWESTVDAAVAEGNRTLDFEPMVRSYIMQSGTKTVCSHLDSPVASAKAAVPSSTPATQPKPSRQPVVRNAAEPEFLKNRDLHGLEPALSVRTRILLASHAMNRMSMSLDIAKSFQIAGYFPRVRFALLLLFCCCCCVHHAYLQTSET